MSLTTPPLTPDRQKAEAAHKAMEFVRDRQLLGLGTGSTMKYFLTTLGQRVQQGLQVRGVPTSQATAEYARQQGIPLLSNEECWDIDVAVDGADQVDPRLDLVKGGGGALLREKIVARAARQFIVIVDQAKQVPHLGLPFPLPVEIVPFGWRTTQRHLENLGWPSVLRQENGQPFVTDNGNYVVDVQIPEITEPSVLETSLKQIPGVVECGLFVRMASLVIVGTSEGPLVIHA